MNVTICRAAEYSIRRVLRCPNCRTKRRMLLRDALWYGPTMTCCHCGDSWGDGERLLRSNRRGWRKEAAAKATAAWLAAGRYDRSDHRAWAAEHTGIAP